jgi:phage-related minor tail protein
MSLDMAAISTRELENISAVMYNELHSLQLIVECYRQLNISYNRIDARIQTLQQEIVEVLEELRGRMRLQMLC